MKIEKIVEIHRFNYIFLFCVYKMVEITAETFAKYCIYNIIDKEHNLTKQQIKKYKTHESELIKDKIFMYAHEDIITPTTMHCRVSTPKTIEFRSKLGFNQYDITLSK